MSAQDDQVEWTQFMHGYVYWEMRTPEHLPPASDEDAQRGWLEGFLQSHADRPDDPEEWLDPERGEGAHAALRRLLTGQPGVDADALLALLSRLLAEWDGAGEFHRMRL